MSYKVVAVVPMRHSSERVKGKNYRDFAGKPLFHHIIESLLESDRVDKVIIDTDSPTIMEQASSHFPEVMLLERPEHLRDGAIPMNNVLLNICNSVESEFYLQTHSTNPLLSADTISKGIDWFLKNYPIYDSMFGVNKFQVRLWDQLSRAINHNPAILLRTQDLPPIYMENSCMYMFTKEMLVRKNNRIGDRPLMYEIPDLEAQDIDVELNFKVAEFLYKETKNKVNI
ncbi:cytidylyltransferase domain-containing protein [Dyadobacter sp. CY351]|uniref:acylneuraminate cytidylyltransferase family protein n=1 Tax=Dyadobacter sp. CY351 TaxID=2909337 RepID=UPI001F3DD009|nr:acylneuraminate cytidylyltransferase family protein [Dyadobacter sp. CY351]MCF2518430.1 acylneuraminate cytidylyltransferase family protein [Dyadobacter sp. CY351]